MTLEDLEDIFGNIRDYVHCPAVEQGVSDTPPDFDSVRCDVQERGCMLIKYFDELIASNPLLIMTYVSERIILSHARKDYVTLRLLVNQLIDTICSPSESYITSLNDIYYDVPSISNLISHFNGIYDRVNENRAAVSCNGDDWCLLSFFWDLYGGNIFLSPVSGRYH